MRKWITELMEHYAFLPQEFAILTKAAESWDLAEKCRVIIARRGPTYIDRFGAPRSRPECAILRDSKIAFIRCLAALNLGTEEEPEEEKRHPRIAPLIAKG
jgi:hypothetical protein